MLLVLGLERFWKSLLWIDTLQPCAIFEIITYSNSMSFIFMFVVTLYLRKKNDIATFIECMAYLYPMQLRGPRENGR